MRFGRSQALTPGSAEQLKLAWLAGLLEAEGTFLRPVPSAPASPAIACQMNDADVVERVAGAFGTALQAVRRSDVSRPVYVARVRGARAVALMRRLAPAMSGRRQQAITAALRGHRSPGRKLDFDLAEAIRELRTLGASVSFLAEAFEVSRPTIRQVLERSIYRSPSKQAEGCAWTSWTPEMVAVRGLLQPELWWLAGWLEGEGSFVSPPPSDPRRARISGVTCDADVAGEVGRLLDVRPRLSHSPREARLGRAPIWQVLRRGARALELMKALRPLMGVRRREQIDRALAAVDRAD